MVTTETNVDDLRQRQRYDRPSNLQKEEQKSKGDKNQKRPHQHSPGRTQQDFEAKSSKGGAGGDLPANEGLATLPDPQKPGEIV